MTRVIVCGGCGKMASSAAKMIYQDKSLILSHIVEAPGHTAIGKDWGRYIGIGEAQVPISDDLSAVLSKGDVVVDFTNPEATMNHLSICSKQHKAMIIGTTGLSEDQQEQIEISSHKIPIVFSPNMSTGVNVLFELVRQVSSVLDDQYDIEIIETHHRYKKDAPSGTAKKIADIIAAERDIHLADKAVYGRHGHTGLRKKGEIGIHAVRAGHIAGEHTVIFNSSGERIELTHKAYGKESFAMGTVKAAKFIVNYAKGLFDMKSVLQMGKID